MTLRPRTILVLNALLAGAVFTTGCPRQPAPSGLTVTQATGQTGNKPGGFDDQGGTAPRPDTGGHLPIDPGPVPPPPPEPSNGGVTLPSSSFLSGLVMPPATIISSNGASIISNNGSAIISNNGSAIISNNGSAIISTNGSAIISTNGSAYRLLDASGPNGILKNAFLYLTNRDEKFYRNTQTGAAFTATTDSSGKFTFPISDQNGFPVGKDVIVNAIANQNLRMTGFLSPGFGANPLNLTLGTTLATELVRGEASRLDRTLGSFDPSRIQNLARLTDAAIARGDIAAVKTVALDRFSPDEPSSKQVGVFDLRMDHVYDLRNQYVAAISAVDPRAAAASALKTLSDGWKALLGFRPVAVTSLLGNGYLPAHNRFPGTYELEGDERYGKPHLEPNRVPAGYAWGVAVAENGDIFFSSYTEAPNSGHIRWLQKQPDGSYRVSSLTNTHVPLVQPQGICIERDPSRYPVGTILVTDAYTERVYRYYIKEDAPSPVPTNYAYKTEIVAGNADYNIGNEPPVVADGYPWGSEGALYPKVTGATPARSRWRLSEEGDQPARFATLAFPQDVKVDEKLNIYIADTENHRIRMIPAEDGYYYDYREPVDANTDGEIDYDLVGGKRVYKFAATPTLMKAGHIYTIAGCPDWAPDGRTADNGRGRWFGEYGGDGARAQAAKLDQPVSLAYRDGYLYIADWDNQRIRRVARDQAHPKNGLIETFAGNPQGGQRGAGTDRDYQPGTAGDGGPAIQAQLAFPNSIAFDRKGRLYIADNDSGRLRMIDTSGVITTVAGRMRTPESPASSDNYTDGEALHWADLFDTQGIATDPDGNVIFSDLRHRRLRKLWRQWE